MTDTVIALDISTAVMLIFGVINLTILGPVAWILKGVIADIKKLDQQHHEFKDHVHLEYARLSEIREIKDLLNRIFDKLDGKADKVPPPAAAAQKHQQSP